MEIERISNLLEHVESLESKVEQLTREINKFKLDEHIYIKSNASISPSIAPKVAYDKNGLIIEGMKLDPSDIPDLQISQISGLRQALSNIITESDLKKAVSELKGNLIKKSDRSVSTATKVNYDSNGFVVSGSELSPDDIPNIPMSKIQGLPDLISIIESMSNNTNRYEEPQQHITKSGTYTKISVDTTGKVLSGEKLNMNDLPIDLINRINQLESMMVDMTPNTVTNNILKTISDKVDSNGIINSGTYTKVTIDEKGLVTNGSELTKNDLPTLNIDDITGLRAELNHTARYTDIADLNDALSHITSNLDRIGDVSQLKNDIKSKANADDVDRMIKEFDALKSRIDKVLQSLPSELIVQRLNNIISRLSTLEGKIAVLESKIK